MCWNLRIHAMVISIICLILTGLASLDFIITIGKLSSGHFTSNEVSTLLGGGVYSPASVFLLVLQISISIYWIVSEVLCLAGAIKNNKCLLIPFMIGLCLPILGCVGLIILMIIYGFLDAHPHDPYGKIDLLVRMIPICIILGFSIYFLVIIVKFYKELASGIVDGQREGVVLQTFDSPLAPPAGTQVVNASSELEKSSYPPQQYPHEQPQPPIISQSYIQ